MTNSRRLAANFVTGFSANITRLLVQVIMLPLMARLLGPAELGLYALAMPMINFVLLLSDAGIGDSLAKERSRDGVIWSSAFWGLMLTGCVSAAAVYAASFPVADMAHQPRLPDIMLPLSATLLLVALTIIPSAMMVRRGNMVPGAIADMAGNISGAAIAILLAWRGFGVWALVAQYVVTYLIRAIGYNIAQPFIPRLAFHGRSLLSHGGMGGQILAGRLLELATSMFERSRVSLKLGPTAVGGYANANQIGIFASNAAGSPIWANLYYIALNRKDDEVAAAHARAHRLFALLVFPAATIMAVSAPAAVPLLLGARWDDSIGSIVVMLLSAPFGNLGVFHTAILYARNLGHHALLGQSLALLFRIGVVIFFWPYGILGLSIGLGVVSLGYYCGTTILASRLVGNRAAELFGVMAVPLLASALVGIILYLFQSPEPSLLDLVSAAFLGLLGYALLLLLLDRRHVENDIRAARAIFGPRPAMGPA